MRAEVFFRSRSDEEGYTRAGDPQRLVDIADWSRVALDRMPHDHPGVKALGNIKANQFSARHVADFQAMVVHEIIPILKEIVQSVSDERDDLAAQGANVRNHEHLIAVGHEKIAQIKRSLDDFLDVFLPLCRSPGLDLAAQAARIEILRDLDGAVPAAGASASAAMRM